MPYTHFCSVCGDSTRSSPCSSGCESELMRLLEQVAVIPVWCTVCGRADESSSVYKLEDYRCNACGGTI